MVIGFSAASEPFQLHQGEISHTATTPILIHDSLNFSRKQIEHVHTCIQLHTHSKKVVPSISLLCTTAHKTIRCQYRQPFHLTFQCQVKEYGENMYGYKIFNGIDVKTCLTLTKQQTVLK